MDKEAINVMWMQPLILWKIDFGALIGDKKCYYREYSKILFVTMGVEPINVFLDSTDDWKSLPKSERADPLNYFKFISVQAMNPIREARAGASRRTRARDTNTLIFPQRYFCNKSE